MSNKKITENACLTGQRIKDMAAFEKPEEKLMEYGAGVLSDAELLALILRTGTKDMNVISLSQLILNAHPVYKGLHGLNYRHINELMSLQGVGSVKACQIIALTEISRRMSEEHSRENMVFDSPDTVADYFMESLRHLTKERVYALFLSSSNECMHKVMISEGSIDRSIVSPAEIFKEAFKCNARSIILIHNHPSGNPEPSDMDIIITKKIKELGDMLGIELFDHIIIGDKKYTSFKYKGIIV